MNPAGIPDEEKRSTLIQLEPDNELNKRIGEIRNSNPDKKLVLFHPLASTELRTIPAKYVEGIVRYLGRIKEYLLVAAVPLPGKDLPIADLSSQCKTFKDLCFIVSQMDGIFTVDTSIYHIAACFDIPAVVWFTSINPELRVRYYPTVTGILLDGARQMTFYNKHILGENDNYANVEKLWGNLDLDRSVRDLKGLCAERNA
jgi:ADP-heptose:LPS heptosyltransferase